MRVGMHPSQAAGLDTAGLRRGYLVEEVFRPEACTLTVLEAERFVFGGIMPTTENLGLPEAFARAVDAAFPLERRELALIDVGGEGVVEDVPLAVENRAVAISVLSAGQDAIARVAPVRQGRTATGRRIGGSGQGSKPSRMPRIHPPRASSRSHSRIASTLGGGRPGATTR